jgi:hypothetical protein
MLNRYSACRLTSDAFEDPDGLVSARDHRLSEGPPLAAECGQSQYPDGELCGQPHPKIHLDREERTPPGLCTDPTREQMVPGIRSRIVVGPANGA